MNLSRAQIIERHRKFETEIRSLIHDGCIKASAKSPDGTPLFDESVVLAAVTIHAIEADIVQSGSGVRSHKGLRALQYDDAAKRLGL